MGKGERERETRERRDETERLPALTVRLRRGRRRQGAQVGRLRARRRQAVLYAAVVAGVLAEAVVTVAVVGVADRGTGRGRAVRRVRRRGVVARETRQRRRRRTGSERGTQMRQADVAAVRVALVGRV